MALIDMQMPGISVPALAAEIRNALGSAVMPLVGLVTPGLREAPRPELFTASLTKPVKASRLYDALIDEYKLEWKTVKAWANSCRTIELALADGTWQTLDVNFVK